MIKLLAVYIVIAHLTGVIIDTYLYREYRIPAIRFCKYLHSAGLLFGIIILGRCF